MSRYAWLACTDCKTMVWLGKAVINQQHIEYIHPGGTASEAEKHTLNRVIWKMFADHAGHTLRVITDQDAEYNFFGEYSEIGGDEYGDVDFDTYLAGWPGTAP